jgi:hypothetical protein
MQWVTGLSPGGSVAGTWFSPPTPSSVDVKERVEIYLYSPFWAFVACSRVNFTFYYTLLIPIPKCRFDTTLNI